MNAQNVKSALTLVHKLERSSTNREGLSRVDAFHKAVAEGPVLTDVERQLLGETLLLTATESASRKTRSFPFKAYTGPTAVKHYAAKLRAIAGLKSVSEGTEHVYFVVENEPTCESAKEHAQNMIRFAGVKGLNIVRV